jgi:hypothetical protein
MAKKDKITIYWSPAKFNADTDSWALLYPEPESVLQKAYQLNKHKGIMPHCPAVKDTLKNVYSFSSALTDSFDLPTGIMESIAYTDTIEEPIETDSKLSFYKMRKSSMDGYININYNMGWLFFASEPVEAKMTAPYFPAISPVKGAMFSAGQFNIGKWFRSVSMDYHIPVTSNKFEIEAGDPLFFIDFITDKKIEFRRFNLSPRLHNLANEMGSSTTRYEKRQSLWKRYQMAHNAKIPQMILTEIKRNLLDD